MATLKVIANRFELHSLAGAGGMGSVFRARDRRTGLWVALKLMNVEGRAWQESERFLHEADILAELRHPGIVSYITHGHVEGAALPNGGRQLFLVMEWLEGESLAARLAAAPLSVSDTLLLLRRIADALSVAHERGIVHRDIKPSNLFLRGDQIEQVTLLDFGIARRRVQKQDLALALRLTQGGEVLGTPEYMAPEQARGEEEIGATADIFSLGCVVYQCLTGKPPFRAGSAAAILAKILLETPRPMQEARKGIPESLAALVMRMLAKDPSQRPSDAGALLRELAELGPLSARDRSSGSFAIPAAKGPPASTEAEQRLFCIVLAMPAVGAEKKEKRLLLTRDLARHGAQVEWLLDESLLVMCSGEGSAIDQALRAGRCALLIKSHWPESDVVLATGRAISVGQIPMGEAIDRAANLLNGRLNPAIASAERLKGVFLDDLSAGLLSRRFRVARSPDGWVLLSEAGNFDNTEPLLGKPTPCVGRDQELLVLDTLLRSSIETSRSCAMLLTGPPGIGKSRLRREFVRRWLAKPEPLAEVDVVLAQGDPMNAATPYRLIATVLKRLCLVSGNEPLEIQQFRLRRRLSQNLPPKEAEPIVELLGEICGISFPGRTEATENPRVEPRRTDAPAMRREPGRRQSSVVRAFAQFLRAEATARPQLWLLDDLQWFDPMSIELLDIVLRELSDCRLMVLGIGPPEVRDMFPLLWVGRRRELVLQGLRKPDSERLVRGALGNRVDSQLVSYITEQAGGNTLFLEEMVRAISEGKGDAIPETVLAMLQARLGRLPAEARRVLRLASVCGQMFTRSDLRMFLAAEMDDRSLRSWLQTLIASELIESLNESDDEAQDRFRFRYALARDAAYGLLSIDDRIYAHCLAAQHLEKQGGAPAHYQQALLALEELTETPQKLRRTAELLVSLVRVTRVREPIDQNLARLTRAQSLLRAAQASLAAPDDDLREMHIRYWLGMLHHDNNQMQTAISHFEAVIERNLGGNDQNPMLLLCGSLLGRIYALQGQFGRALWLLQKLMPLLKEDPEHLEPQLIIGITFLSLSMVVSGECRRGLEVAQRVTDLTAQRGDQALISMAHGMHGLTFLAAGQLTRSIQALRTGIALAEQCGALLYLYILLGMQAWVQSKLGQHEAAIESMARADRISRQLGQQLLMSDWYVAIRAEMALNRGQPDEAYELAEEAMGAFRPAGAIFSVGLAHRVMAQSLSAFGTAAWEEVAGHLSASLDCFQSGRALIEVARTHAVWGNLCCTHGRDAEARQHLLAACEQFVQSGLDAELAAAQAAIRTLT